MDLYIEMGARYFMAMGVHHDNFDCWDSTYQPWNSVRVGPKVDIVGTWEKSARQHGMRFGIGFHHTPAPNLGPVHARALHQRPKRRPKQGVPYDALQTILDGKGKWWEGMDPVDLYGTGPRQRRDPLHSPFANQFMWRVDDAITKYHPDVIYFDEHAGDSQVDLGVQMGLGFLAPPLIANYYNKSLQWNQGKMDVVMNLKGVGGRYNSFQNSPELLPFVDRSLVKSTEAIIESRSWPILSRRKPASRTGITRPARNTWMPRASSGADAKCLAQRQHAAQHHPAWPGRFGSGGDPHLQGRRRMAEDQRRGGLCVPAV